MSDLIHAIAVVVVIVLPVIGACLCLLLTYLMKRLLWPVIIATLIVGAIPLAGAWLLFGAIFLWPHRLGLALPFIYAAAGAAIAAVATSWFRRRRARLGESAEALNRRERMRKKALRLMLLACSAVVLMLIAGVVTFRIVLASRIRAELNEIRAQGFPVTLEDLDAWYPQPPAGQNAADVYLKALALCVDEKDKHEQLPTIGSGKLPPAGEPLTQETKSLLEAYVADNREALKLLHQAAAMPLCRFPVDFNQAYQGTNPKLAAQGWILYDGDNYVDKTVRVWRLLSIEALIDADNGNAAEAAEAIVCMLGVGRALGNEPLVNTQIMHTVFSDFAVESLQRTLSRTTFSDDDLRRVDDSLKDAVNLDGMTRALATQRCLQSSAFTNRKIGAAVARLMDSDDLHEYEHRHGPALLGTFLPPLSWRLRFLGLLDMDHLHYLWWANMCFADWQNRDCRGGLFDSNPPALPSPIPQSIAQALFCDFSYPFVVGWPMLARDNYTIMISEVELARTGIAVERYRNARGGIPEKLSDLVPAYLPAVPLDPWDGKPLRYRKLDKGYIIYSVGTDRKDEGGSSDPEQDFKNITFRVAR